MEKDEEKVIQEGVNGIIEKTLIRTYSNNALIEESVINEYRKTYRNDRRIINKKITVAIMGCVVNGPGEAKEADIGIAGGIGEGLLIKKGQIIKKVPEDMLLAVLKEELDSWE